MLRTPGDRLSFRAAVFLFAAGALAGEDSRATLVIRNSNVWTGDPKHPQAQAVAVEGCRIAAVGTEKEIRDWIGPLTMVIDGRGATLLPGFIDAHFHFLDLSTTGGEVPLNLRFIDSREEFVDVLARHAQTVPEGTWIFGEGWDERKWGGERPSKEWIDRVSPHRPVWLLREFGDSGLANSAALQLAGITRATRERPEEGIVCDRNGEPTGLIRGGPMWLMDKILAERVKDKAGRSAEEVMKRLVSLGVTSVQHTGNCAASSSTRG